VSIKSTLHVTEEVARQVYNDVLARTTTRDFVDRLDLLYIERRFDEVLSSSTVNVLIISDEAMAEKVKNEWSIKLGTVDLTGRDLKWALEYALENLRMRRC